MRCNDCNLHQKSITQVMPKGSIQPDIYFIIDGPDEEDLRFNQILTGPRGRFLESFLGSLGIMNYRMWSLTRCAAYATEYEDGVKYGDKYVNPQDAAIRQPNDEEVSVCSKFVTADILKTNPKIIVPLGGLPSKWLLGDQFSKITKERGKVFKSQLNGVEFTVMPTYSPSYIIKNNGDTELARVFFEDLKKAYQLSNGTYVDVMEENKMTFALDYATFKNYVVNELSDVDDIAYDIETNAELIYDKKFDIIGWSLAKKRNGIYVCVDSLDYTMSPQDRELCRKLLVAVLQSKKKVTVHNSLYERPATIYNLGYELTFDQLDDTLVMAKLMLGGKIGAGLKENAQKIGYPSWEDDKDDYVKLFKTLLSRLKLVKHNGIVELMKEGHSLYEIRDMLLSENEENASKFEEIFGYIDDFTDIVKSYYEDYELPNLMKLFTAKVVYGMENGIPSTVPYNWIPYKLLCKYGATDSLATVDLKEHFLERFKNESTPDVNLFKGYKYALQEHYAGFAMMMSGLKWDDDAAERDYRHFYNICVGSLKYILSNEHLMDYVVDQKYDEYVPDVIYEYYSDYFWEHYEKRPVVIDTDRHGNNEYKLEYKDGDKIKKKHIKHLMVDVELPETIVKDTEQKIADIIRKEIDETSDLETLKRFFNPASTTSDIFEIATKVLVTDELKFCTMLKGIQDVVHDEAFNLDNYSDKDKTFLTKFIEYLKLDPSVEDFVEKRKVPYEELKQIAESIVRFDDEDLQKIMGDAMNYKLDGLDDGTQIAVYDSLRIGPLDPDNSETWTPQFKWLVNLRWYKKSYKVMSAYIEGKVGRSSVWVVPKDQLENGDDIVYRLREYDDNEFKDGKPVLAPNEAMLEQTQFGVGTAETGRWRSAYHVLPTGSSVKKLYTSRFRGGTILQPDFSANELRCVASAAQEENMLQAFREGKDIHRSNAAKIYRVPEEEVTTFQRRFAKTLSFMTLYGGGAYSMADEYFGGDVAKAQKQLDDFFSAFPGLKTWIDARHKECMETGKVSVLTQRFLNIDFDRNDKRSVASAMRAAQNYPIQSAASTIAAVIFADIIKFMRENHMKSKPVLFIHDSLETDIYPYELLAAVEYQKERLANGALDYFNIACKADISMGYSLGHECELASLEVLDEKHTKAYITLEGWKDEIDDTVNNWKLAYHKVDVIEEEWKDTYIPISQSFIPRKAFDPTTRTVRQKGKVKYYIQYYNENGEIDPVDKSDTPKINNPWEKVMPVC